MLITRKSMFTGNIHSMELPVTQSQLDRWEGGELIQNVFPHLTPEQREFVKTGVTPEEWEAAFGKE